MMYKHAEIKEHYVDFIDEQDPEWVADNFDDLHDHAFNTDYYIIGTWKAEQ